MKEEICKKCKKVFIPAPQHVYRDGRGMYCSWHCFNHRNDAKTERKIKKVELHSESGCLLKVFTSATDAAEQTGFDARRIRDACRDQTPYQGFTWKYRE